MFLRIEIFKILAANKVRSSLSLLSFAIGAASVMAIVSLTEGYSIELERINFGGAAKRITVTENFFVQDRYSSPTIDDWREMVRQNQPKIAASFTRSSATYVAKTKNGEAFGPLYGVLGDYRYDSQAKFLRGRDFTIPELNSTQRLCVIGHEVANKLFRSRHFMGKPLRINNSTCKIVGVLDHEAGRNSYMNKAIFMPFWGFLRVTDKRHSVAKAVDLLEFYVSDEAFRNLMVSKIDETMRKRHGAPPAGVPPFLIGMDAGSFEAVSEQRRVATIFLLSLGSLSLITGVLGVMNSMLASVAERKKEIGIRLAIGALPSDIRMQFLAESIVISGIGVGIGVILGLLAAATIGSLYEWPFAVSWEIVALGGVTAIVSGVSAGIYPATKAAQYPPAEVIRSAS